MTRLNLLSPLDPTARGLLHLVQGKLVQRLYCDQEETERLLGRCRVCYSWHFFFVPLPIGGILLGVFYASQPLVNNLRGDVGF